MKVPQQAWIQNMSVRQNVTFGREFCAQFYGKVLDACALTADLSLLPQGDATEIGEKVGEFTVSFPSIELNLKGHKSFWGSKGEDCIGQGRLFPIIALPF